ncbi:MULTISPECIES: ECF transporter S component [unclassified Streptococcus]|uniref:ECF transporter S component n=1 Tax=unclassified Streptococcus TaxID=2608887 RepID=UPI001072A3F6|nr:MULTISPECIES: ECF transporter S component [unclassified Streptococcus]MBF0786394.1 ECF transporter S component [Streptococcus sp. 19428wC2_LYSM12]MCQ9212501.1 ECF transporter S component [Streptococcus sp. B01]MCQ9213840.1 ECF transporter S component [Streptococcus sp. O1]TFV06803.1 ECF transporter S component [Streptococcus sp. LYSM12]
MKQTKSTRIATLAIFFAVMIVIDILSSVIFNLLPVPIKPTIVHIPVIVASILYGPKIGATLGGMMGILSVVHNTIIFLPTSYLFSPFVQNGQWYSLIVAIVPRILIGITPYIIYRLLQTRGGLLVAGAVGSMTNTIFVLGSIFFLFSGVYNGDIRTMLMGIIGTNSIAEMVIVAFLTTAIVPTLQQAKK